MAKLKKNSIVPGVEKPELAKSNPKVQLEKARKQRRSEQREITKPKTGYDSERAAVLRKKLKTVKVKKGDSLFGIAGDLYKKVYRGDAVAAQRMAQELSKANPQAAGGLKPGMKLKVPKAQANPYISQGFMKAAQERRSQKPKPKGKR